MTAALVVDDDRDLLEIVVMIIAGAGLSASGARSGNEAFSRFQRRHPDLLVSDIEMPDGTGLHLIRRIRELPEARGGRIPAIAISGTTTPEVALAAGFQACLPKPFSLHALLDTVRALVPTAP